MLTTTPKLRPKFKSLQQYGFRLRQCCRDFDNGINRGFEVGDSTSGIRSPGFEVGDSKSGIRSREFEVGNSKSVFTRIKGFR
jgi:hypothetical protein